MTIVIYCTCTYCLLIEFKVTCLRTYIYTDKQKEKKVNTNCLWYKKVDQIDGDSKGELLWIYISSDHIFSEYCRKILFLCLEKKSPPDLNVHNGIDLLIYRCFRTVAVDCGIRKPNNN